MDFVCSTNTNLQSIHNHNHSDRLAEDQRTLRRRTAHRVLPLPAPEAPVKGHADAFCRFVGAVHAAIGVRTHALKVRAHNNC